MPVKIRDAAKRVTPEQLQEVEQRLGMSLPDEYRKFLLRTNGGVPEPGGFEFPDLSEDQPGDFDEVELFYSVLVPPPAEFDLRSFESAVRHMRSELKLPLDYVPIAMTVNQEIIALGVDGKARGKVYYWAYISAGFELSFLVELAASFDEFLDSLSETEGD
jgi:hypothetical protein